MPKYPRVVFLTSAAFNKITGGGVTFTNLFRGWPKDRMATVHNDSVATTTDVCDRYFMLGTAEIHKWGVLKRYTGALSIRDVAATAAGHGRPSFFVRAARLAKKVLFGNAIPDAGSLSPDLEDWLAKFKPDLVYTILGTNAMLDLALAIRRRFGTALVVHMMDDWPSVAYRGGMLSWIGRQRMHGQLRHVFSVADVRLSICPDMAEEYQRRYGQPFSSFHNAVDVDRWRSFARDSVQIGKQVRLLYIGSILPEAQLEGLVDCCAAVKRLRDAGMDVVLDIYSPAFYAERFRERLVISEGIRLHGAITDDALVFDQLRAADILLLAVNFDRKTVRYIKYSMPTKVPAYLFSGTPILVYGPSETAQVRYARDSGWGHVVDTRGVARVADAIRTLASDQELRDRLSRAARQAALEHHDAAVVRARFQEALIGSATARRQQRSVEMKCASATQLEVRHESK